MNRKVIAIMSLCFVFGMAKRGAAEDKPKAATSNVDSQEPAFPFDSGPDTIDVSKYPEIQQANYKVFAEKCSKCHTLARPINAPLALPEEWEAYVHKMQGKRRSGVDADSAKLIISFLTYDSSVRKKDLIAKKVQEKNSAKKDQGKDSKVSTDTVKTDPAKTDMNKDKK